MGGKLHKVDRIRIRHRTRLSKSISMQDQLKMCTSQLYKIFCFQFQIFYDGALALGLTRHYFTIIVLKSVKYSICMAYNLDSYPYTFIKN